MLELRRLSKEAIPRALEKAERYRLLREPVEAESICRDILDVEPDNQQAVITLVLALTDQFQLRQNPSAFQDACRCVARLTDDYRKSYYAGIVFERRAKAHLNLETPGSGYVAFQWLTKAMQYFEKAMQLQPMENEDALLRWNSCARIQNANPDIVTSPESIEAVIQDDDPSGPWGAR